MTDEPPDITPAFPNDCEVRGNIYDTDDIAWLDEDQLQVRLPNGVVVDLGWYFHHDRPGEFMAIAIKGSWENPLTDKQYPKDAKEAAAVVSELVERFYGDDPR